MTNIITDIMMTSGWFTLFALTITLLLENQ